MLINRKKTQRLYREEGLTVRRRKGRKRAVGTRTRPPVMALPNQFWSLDFVHDQLATGRRFRVLNVVDDVTQNAFVETFNGRMRDELLNETLLMSVGRAREKLEFFRSSRKNSSRSQMIRRRTVISTMTLV